MSKPFGVITQNGKLVKTDILETYSIKSKEQSNVKDPFKELYNDSHVVEPNYNPRQLSSILEINTYHYKACETKAKDVTSRGFTIKSLNDDASEVNKQILDNFFNFFDLSIFFKEEFDKEATGQGFIEVVRAGYDPNAYPAGLYHIPSVDVRFIAGKNKIVQLVQGKKRWFKKFGYQKDVHKDTGQESELGSLPAEQRATEYLANVKYTPIDDYYGSPDIIPALSSVYGDLARAQFNTAFFNNYGVPAYAVFITGNYDPTAPVNEKGDTLEDIIEDHFRQMQNNPHSTLILGIPTIGQGNIQVDIKPLSVDVKEAAFRMYRVDNRDEVLAAHGVPPYLLGIAETGTLGGSNAEESKIIYKTSVIEPRQSSLESIINHIIREGFGIYDWEFKFGDIDLEDEVQEIANVKELIGLAVMTPNQAIKYLGKKYGLEPVDHPAMDWHYLNGNPIDMETQPSPAPEEVAKSEGEIEDPFIIGEMQKVLDSLVTKSKAIEEEKNIGQIEKVLKSLRSRLFKAVSKNDKVS